MHPDGECFSYSTVSKPDVSRTENLILWLTKMQGCFKSTRLFLTKGVFPVSDRDSIYFIRSAPFPALTAK